VKFLRWLRPTVLDWYIVREVVPPTLLGLVLFTFILLLETISRLMSILVSRGADMGAILGIFLNLLPGILGITVPMSFLLGVLLAFGRLAADSEIVALRASGVSLARLMRPVGLLSCVAGLVTLYIMTVALPRGNQAHRQSVFTLVMSKARSGIKPRVFTDDVLPNMMLYVSDIPAETGRWKNVFLHDLREPQNPRVILAAAGEPVIDDDKRQAFLRLEDGVIHVFDKRDPTKYEQQQFGSFESPLDWDELFPAIPVSRGDREMTPDELMARVAELRAEGTPEKQLRPWIVEWHKRFAIPAACIVFGMLGLGLSMGSKKEARSAAFGLSVAVIFVYYVLIRLGEQAGDTGMLAPILAIWSANAVLGLAGGILLYLQYREAAFDPLNPSHYVFWLPYVRRARPSSIAGPRRPQRRVVIRLPRLGLPAPSLLDRYISRAYVGHMLLVLVSFWAIYVLAEFMDLFDDIQHNNVKGVTVLHYYWYHNPALLYLTLPVAALVTPLITFGVLAKRNETTAIKAGGISLYRTVVPVIVIGAILSALMFGLGDYILPFTNRVAAVDYNRIKGRPPQSTNSIDQRWILGNDQRIYNYEYFSETPQREHPVASGAPSSQVTIYGLSSYDLDTESWRLRERMYAGQARWLGGGYSLENGWRLRLDGDSPVFRAFTSTQTRALEPPEYFMQATPESDTLRLAELGAYIRSLESRGYDVTKLQVQFHRKVAFPAVSLVMTLIGIPFAFVVGRRGALYGIGLSIVIAIVYWATLSIFEALGVNALLPPFLAAWAPNLMFGAAGLYLMLTLET
jgi:LPS export ABC transporter permease LptG/LPS export ABC transporter permease LptF